MSHNTEKYKNIDDIVRGCINQDRVAQRELYNMYAGKMAALCMRYVGDRETSLDIMHDGFVLLFDKIGTYRNDGAFDAWIKRVFINLSLEYLRKNDALKESEDLDEISYSVMSDSANPFEELSAKEIMVYINRLAPIPRAIFNMYAIEGYSHHEIACQLNINEATVRSHYLRARKALQQMILDH